MATRLAVVRTRFFDDQGRPLVGGLIYSYEIGTTTPKPTYIDANAIVLNTNPVILDDTGSASIYLNGRTSVVVHNAADVLLDRIEYIEGGIAALPAQASDAETLLRQYIDGVLINITFPFDCGLITEPVVNNRFDMGTI